MTSEMPSLYPQFDGSSKIDIEGPEGEPDLLPWGTTPGTIKCMLTSVPPHLGDPALRYMG